MAYVYVLQSLKDNWRYIGCTANLQSRLAYHNKGKVTSTKPHKPFAMVYTESYQTMSEARQRENHLKKYFKAREEVYNKIEALSSNG